MYTNDMKPLGFTRRPNGANPFHAKPSHAHATRSTAASSVPDVRGHSGPGARGSALHALRLPLLRRLRTGFGVRTDRMRRLKSKTRRTP
jgi:hypothetical protein